MSNGNAGPVAHSVFRVGDAPWMQPSCGPADLEDPGHAHDQASRTSIASEEEVEEIVDGEGTTVVNIADKHARNAEMLQQRIATRQQEEEVQKLEQELLAICKMNFIVGCFALPLLHLVNVMYFREEMRGSDSNPHIQTYARLSFSVAVFWTVVIAVWVITLQIAYPGLLSISQIGWRNLYT